MADKMEEVLRAVPLTSLPPTPLGSVKTLSSDQTVADALQELHENNILSAPVVDPSQPEDAHWKDKFIGMVDVLTLAVFVMESMESNTGIPEVDETLPAEELDKFVPDFSSLPSEFGSKPLSSLVDNDRVWSAFLPLENTSTLLDATVLLSAYRMKRLPIVDPSTNTLVNVVSQSTLVRLIAEQGDKFGDICNKTLDDLGLGEPQPIHSVRAEQPVKDAFDLIRKQNISGVPVMGAEGAIVGNISARDIYFIVSVPNKLHLLHLPTTQFIDYRSMRQGAWNTAQAAITCKSSDSLGAIMQRLAAAKIHRIYLCDEKNHPYRVISLCDVLEKFISMPEVKCDVL